MKRFFIVILLIGASLFMKCYGQTMHFVNYNVKQGLPQSNVFNIFQDNKGYLWFGTEAGVCYYDGREFVTFDEDNGLPSSKVKAICQDKYSNIWFGTDKGVCMYNGKEFKNISSKEMPTIFKRPRTNSIRTLFLDNNDMLWIGTDGGLISYDQDTSWNYYWLEFLEDSTKSFYSPKYIDNVNKYRQIFQDKEGTLWFGGMGGLLKYKDNTFYNYTTEDGLVGTDVMGLTEGSDNNLYIATLSGGISIFDKKNNWKTITTANGLCSNEIISIFHDDKGATYAGTVGQGVCIIYPDGSFVNLTQKEGLSNPRVLAILKDKQGTFWFGTEGGGVCKFNGKRFQIYSEESTKKTIIDENGAPHVIAGLSNNNIRSIFQDKDGAMWFGSFGGACRWDGEKYETFSPGPGGLSSPYIMDIFRDKSGRMWFGTFVGSACVYDGETFSKIGPKQGLSSPHVLSIFQDRDSSMWFGTFNGIFKHAGDSFINYTSKNTNKGLAQNIVVAIYQDLEGRMWFGIDGGGVSVFDGEKFTSYTKDTTNNCLAHNVVRSIFQDVSGTMWFGTDGGGISLFDGKNFETFDRKKGLHSNNIWIMLPDNRGNVWIGHKKGVEKINQITRKVTHYSHLEGFSPIEVNAGAGCKDRDGNLWFGTVEGAVKYSPEEDDTNSTPPITHITEMKLFHRHVSDSVWKEHADSFNYQINLPINPILPHDINFVSFKYIGIHTHISEKVKYKYYLKGLEEDWQPSTKEVQASYSNLDPGDYVFLIKAMSAEGIWSKTPSEFSFTIDLPWWEKWWYYASEASFFLILFGISVYLTRKGSEGKMATAMIFITMLVLVEFLIMIIENYIEQYTGGVPVVKLVLNIVLALSFHPVQELSDKWIQNRRFKQRISENIELNKV